MRSFQTLWPKWQKRLKSPLYLISVFLILIILVGGLSLRRNQEKEVKKITYQQLSAIAEMKAADIRRWLDERKGDARVMSESPFFAVGLLELMKNPDPSGIENIKARLDLAARTYGYVRAMILDGDKRPFITYGAEPPSRLTEVFLEDLNRAEKTGVVVNSDLHRDGDLVHIDIVAPIFRPGSQKKQAGAFLVLTMDANDFLFPLIQTWPFNSSTAETILVRREGEDVVFLNDASGIEKARP